MNALVVFESTFGNTEAIAKSIAAGLASHLNVELWEVNRAPRVLDGFELVVVGGPTQAFSMSRPGTRRNAAQQAGRDPDAVDVGVREWLGAIERVPASITAAAFDT